MTSSRLWRVAATLAAVLAVGGCGDDEGGAAAGGQEGKTTTVKMASLGVASDAAMMLGRKKGFFEQEGIDLQVEQVGAGGAAIAPAVLKGEYDVAGGGIDGPGARRGQGAAAEGDRQRRRARKQGHDADRRAPRTARRGSPFPSRLADPQRRGPRGQEDGGDHDHRPAVPVHRGGRREGRRDRDQLKILEIPAPEMLPALEAGRVEAAALVEPFITVARKQGMRIIDDPCVDAIPGAIQAGYFTSEKWANENADAAARLSKALVRSNEYANDHPDEVRAILPEYTKITPGLAKAITLAPYDTGGENTLTVIADKLEQYGLIDSKPDIDSILTNG